MKHRRSLPLATALALVVFSCYALAQGAPEDPEKLTPLPGFDEAAMDTGADPCVDFYQYAFGNFAKLHPIPADMPEFDQFVILSEFNTQARRGLVEMAGAAGTKSRRFLRRLSRGR
jgi:predicted metalloendopeptidase